jgi:hypothetical protein
MHMGNMGDSLQQLKERVEHFFPSLGNTNIRLGWRKEKDGKWEFIGTEEEFTEAMKVIQEQGRPVARLMIGAQEEEEQTGRYDQGLLVLRFR